VNYYKRHLGDFARDTAHLSQGQVGAYDLLLDWYYANERALPADMEDVYRIAKAHSKEERKNADKARAFFDAAGRHKRCDAELAARKRQADINAETGRKGGRPKKKTETEPNGNRIGFASDTETEPNTNPSHKPVAREEKEPTTLAQRAARFDEFWSLYPNRKGKSQALAKWKARSLDSMADRIIADVRNRIARDRQWLDGFVPHGSTYINGSGWEDDIEPVRLKAVAGGGYQPLPGEL
jgi:uncharacterized protein YdaU (DUF1376 family)